MKNFLAAAAAVMCRRFPFLLVVVILLLPAVCRAGGYVKVGVEEITYFENDTYEICTMMSNRSDGTVTIVEYGKSFFIQNDIVGRWTELAIEEIKDSAPVSLAPNQTHTVPVMVKIPRSIPNLYVNSDNEVNIRFKHWVSFMADLDKRTVRMAGESSYWLKLGTDEWILREGM